MECRRKPVRAWVGRKLGLDHYAYPYTRGFWSSSAIIAREIGGRLDKYADKVRAADDWWTRGAAFVHIMLTLYVVSCIAIVGLTILAMPFVLLVLLVRALGS